ncbi:Starch-binding associating with outer membrane [Saccharicrinis carchari]|uniref:Starch-binding associating with outer membrane n=1 Tax=Saccharicrinis carchari TaxID=1168039 RepID=A0A521B3X5_SACCC|nr:SusD/RagB family nutrient-binding outer membrane lipoprotein [Saccharicrinis carchari]SMO41755.1 Starch-binding associating with outer membrane [Saccharicrinis carchari]
MKYLNYIVVLIVALGPLTSCDDFLGDNLDPDRPVEVSMDLVMPTVLFYAVLQNYDHSEYGTYLSQCLTTAGRSQTGAYAYRSGWEFMGMNRHPQWRRHFFDVGSNANNVVRYAQADGSVNYLAVTRLIRLLSVQQTTDIFGDMPLTTAYTENPVYESQESIYEWMENEAEELIALFASSDVLKASNQPMTKKQDRIYGGDMAKWKQLAYAVKARILLRNLPNINTNADICNRIIVAGENALNGWVDPNYKFDGGNSVEKNCFWGRTNRPVNSWESRANDLDGAIPSKFLMENMLMYDPQSETSPDPRLKYLMKARGDEGKGIDTTYRYLENNIGMPATHQINWYPEFYDKSLTTDTSTICLLTKGELHFIVAEAAYWAGDKTKALDHMKMGTRYHMNRMGVPATVIDAYMLNSSVVPGTANLNLSHIMREKYIAMYLQPEQWNDLRRYAYSNEGNGIQYDERAIYPGLNRPHNLYEAYWGDENTWIQRLNYDPETEEKYNRTQLEKLGAFRNPEWLKKPMIWGRQ